MRRIYPLLVFAMLLYSAEAQQTTFRIQYNVSIFDLPGGIVQNPTSSNYVFSGTNASLGTTGHLFELNPNGIVNWSKAYSAGGLSTQFSDIKNISGGGYIVTGGTGSGCLLMKVDNAGVVQWANRYRVSSADGSSEYGNRVIQTSDGGFVVAGSVTRVDPDGAGGLARTDSSKMFAMKVNSAGTLQWMRTFFYTTAFDDDDYLNDVAEVSDGYVFVGSATIVGGDGQSDAVMLKTDVSGTLQWARRWGNSNSEGAYSIINNGTSEVAISGDDNGRAFILRVTTPNTGPVTTGTNSLYTTTGFSALGSSLVKAKEDGQFVIFGTRIGVIFTPPFLDYSAFLLKSNPTNGSITWIKSYNSGFVSILPVGLQAADSGYVMNSISATLQSASYDYGVVKTDILGSQNANLGCPPTTPTFSRSNYAPTYTAFTPTIVTTGATSSVSMTSATVGQTTGIVCQYIACNAPPQPTVTASQNNVCPNTQVTISASGGTNVTYKVYTQATGGTSIGNAPLNVTPSTTTTYYVEADDNNNPGCVSTRGSVTVTVVQPPAAIGNITGLTTPCPGTQAYSITAVSGATSYTWALSGGGTITSGQGTTGINVNWTSSGAYTVSVTATNSCGSTNKTLSVTVQAGPPAAVGTITGSSNPCPGSQTYTIANVANATSYTWAVSGGGTISSGQGTTSLTVNWTTSGGPYTVSVTATNNCGSTSNSLAVNVQNGAPGTLGSISGPATPCLGSQTYSVTAVSGSPTYTWSVSGGGTITSGQGTTSVNINWTTAGGPYTVSVTAANTCGNNSQTLAVTVSPGVSGVTATASPNPACVGDAVILSGSGNGVNNWSWSGPNNFTSTQQSPTVSSVTTAGAGTYTLTASSTCGTATATVNLTVTSAPQNVTATANPNPACAGNTITFTGSGTGATSWSWSGPNNFSSTQQNPTLPNAQANASGVYTLTATNACGNSTATANLTVNEAPTGVTATSTPEPVCQGGTVNLSGTATGAVSYAWSGPSNFSSSQLNASISNFLPANAGTYTLSATNSCGTTTATVAVTISTVPTGVTATANLTNICFNSQLTLNGTANGATSYSWTGPNGFSSTQQSASIANVTLADSGTYTFTATNTCGSTTATVTVDVDTTIENVSINASPNDTICSGGTINLSATGNNVNNWAWTGPNNFTSALQNPTIANATSVNSGTYTVTATNACGNSSASLNVLVNTIPITPGTINGSLTTCGSDTATYTVTGISNATSYNWTVSAGGSIIAGQGTTSIDVLWGGAPGNYTVSVTAGNSCGNSTATSITVTVQPPAPVMNAVITGEVSVCPGVEAYNITSIPNATGYTWTLGSGGNIASGQGTNSISVNWTTAGVHTLSVVATNTCGTSSAATIDVTVHPSPTVAAVVLTDDTICEGSSTTLTASGSTGGNVNYNFYDAPVGGNMYASNPLTVSPTQTTTYYLEVINQFGCTGASGRQPVTVYVIPAPAVLNVSAASDSLCYNSSTVLTATATPGATITWWDAPIAGNQLGSGNTYNVDSLKFSTTYYVQATSTGGCANLQGRVAVNVAVIDLPVVTITTDKDNNTAFPNEAITFTASPSGYSHYEFFVNGTSVQSGPLNTWASAKLSDKDTVSVIATDNGCNSLESEVVVTIADFPNAFTPNSDGVNDIFLKNYDLVILNRWGQELYRGFDGWDGTYNGDKVSAGTYFYIVTVKNITDRDTQVKGNVLLIQE